MNKGRQVVAPAAPMPSNTPLDARKENFVTHGAYSLKEYAASRSTPKEIRNVLNEMHDLGWTARPRGKRGYWAVPPEPGADPYYVPITIKDVTAVAHAAARALDKWKHWSLTEGLVDAVVSVAKQVNLEEGGRPVPYCGQHGQAFMTWDDLSEHVRDTHGPFDPDPVEEAEPEPVTEVSSGDQSCTIVEDDGSIEVTTPDPGVSRKPRGKTGPHARHSDWQQIRGPLAREIYEAMRARSQAHMALSTYANALAMDIEAKRLEEGRTGFDDGATLLQLVQSLVSQVEVDNDQQARIANLEGDLAEALSKLDETSQKYGVLKAKWDTFMSLAKEE